MRKIIFTTLMLAGLFMFNEAAAQSYESAVGGRASYYLTGTYKKFLNETNAFEAYAGLYGFGGIIAGGMLQIHKPLEELEIDNLQWYFGGGAFAGTAFSNYFFIGVNGVIGLDYRFDEYPINVSVDWAPGLQFNIWRYSTNVIRPAFAAGGLSVRYILGE
jgi:hypothetical protein